MDKQPRTIEHLPHNLKEVYEFLGIRYGSSFNDNDGFGVDYDNDKKLKITNSFGVEIVRIRDVIVECDDGSFTVIPRNKEYD